MLYKDACNSKSNQQVAIFEVFIFSLAIDILQSLKVEPRAFGLLVKQTLGCIHLHTLHSNLVLNVWEEGSWHKSLELGCVSIHAGFGSVLDCFFFVAVVCCLFRTSAHYSQVTCVLRSWSTLRLTRCDIKIWYYSGSPPCPSPPLSSPCPLPSPLLAPPLPYPPLAPSPPPRLSFSVRWLPNVASCCPSVLSRLCKKQCCLLYCTLSAG